MRRSTGTSRSRALARSPGLDATNDDVKGVIVPGLTVLTNVGDQVADLVDRRNLPMPGGSEQRDHTVPSRGPTHRSAARPFLRPRPAGEDVAPRRAASSRPRLGSAERDGPPARLTNGAPAGAGPRLGAQPARPGRWCPRKLPNPLPNPRDRPRP